MMNNVFNLLKRELVGVKKKVLLKDYTTFKIGGPAEYFLIVKEKETLIKAINVAKKLHVPVFVFGG